MPMWDARDAVGHMKQDVLFAIRQLITSPSFALAAIITLALGIGATAAVFTVVNAVVLRPLPFAEPDRVVNLHPARDGTPLGSDNASAPNVAIINETLAKRFWPGQVAIGKRIEGTDPSHRYFMEVVGVVADPRTISPQQASTPEYYIPFEQMPAPLWGARFRRR